ncbi:MAG: hypothetical protein QF893_06050 [Alphaproteobacteria bacterium]|jgi:hypothetical protein|nr:hypothetical protein [Alphaproteobacteria bacterium]
MANAGWPRFYNGAALQESAYINDWNFPGFSAAACDKLIQVEERKRVRINGIVMDNIGIDSAENSAGPKGDLVTDSWHCHVRGLQRGWKFVENAANLGQLAEARPGSCALFVRAPKLVSGTGGPLAANSKRSRRLEAVAGIVAVEALEQNLERDAPMLPAGGQRRRRAEDDGQRRRNQRASKLPPDSFGPPSHVVRLAHHGVSRKSTLHRVK